jgi:cyanophycin synthetase
MTVFGTVTDFPITMGGTAGFQVANLLAAIAACRALEMRQENFVPALMNFDNAVQNRGRTNLYQVDSAYLLVDYGHNVGAFRAICDMTAKWQGKRVTGVVSLPGDRSDSLLTEAARVPACGFDRLIIREDMDKRGRSPGEVAHLFEKAVRDNHPRLAVQVIVDEHEAFSHALRTAEPGEVIVLFYDDYAVLNRILQQFGATPAQYEAHTVLRTTTPRTFAAAAG